MIGLAAASVLVARVAVCAVPDVAPDALMDGVGLRLRVALRAEEDRVIRRIGVAIAAQLRRVVRNLEPSVVEGCAEPACSGVAGCACRRETGSDVVRRVCALIVRLVAGVAIGWRPRVLTVDVAA